MNPQELKNRYSALMLKANSLHFKAIHEPLLSEKDRLSSESGQILVEANKIMEQLEQQQKEEDIHEGRAIASGPTIVCEINDVQLPIDNNLKISVQFSCGQHKETLSIGDLIPFHQKRYWQDIKEGMPFTGRINCKKCRQDKAKRIGSATWRIRGRV